MGAAAIYPNIKKAKAFLTMKIEALFFWEFRKEKSDAWAHQNDLKED
jgi:hypothetical protein